MNPMDEFRNGDEPVEKMKVDVWVDKEILERLESAEKALEFYATGRFYQTTKEGFLEWDDGYKAREHFEKWKKSSDMVILCLGLIDAVAQIDYLKKVVARQEQDLEPIDKLNEQLADARTVIELHAGNGSPAAIEWLDKYGQG